ncbi:MAG: threonine synthase [Methanosarcinales archaeon]|uniref:Threonine synthase n=1 Tax=Candidatus Ethanoperedens thermophilum TaxID=2766897 RepID=A0A848DB71_9EURY|nr:threonine synthase [Candidatus Ethanoperedens thermophilum]
MYHLQCIECSSIYSIEEVVYTCRKCGGLLDVIYNYNEIELSKKELSKQPLSVWKYKKLLPITRDPVTLQEGGTQLYKLHRLAEDLEAKEVYVKHEGMNPTGSFKDRGMTVGVTKALELGMSTVACASTGNTSASLSIYGAKAGIPAVVLLPAGKVALGKVAQALMHGAKVLSIRGNFDEALTLVRDLCAKEDFYLLNSINPYRLEGQKTIGFEIADQLGWEVPDRIVLPVGNAGNITAIYKGFKELKTLGITDTVPKMIGIQAEGAPPIVNAVRSNQQNIIPDPDPETIATAIRIGNPVNARKALKAVYESGGTAETVTDEEIITAQKQLAQMEGIGVEPASASSIAGLRKLLQNGTIDPDERIVCIATGHLLKDSEHVLNVCPKPIEINATIEDVRKAVFA